MARATWERLWHSGEVRVYCRYDDDSDSWIVRAVHNKSKATVQVPDSNWLAVKQRPVDTTEAYLYATTRGMNMIIEDEKNEEIRNNCSYKHNHSVHIGRSFKLAWSDYDNKTMRKG